MSFTRRKAVLWVSAAVALTLGGFAAYPKFASPHTVQPPQFQASDVTGVPWGHGFELIDHHGTRRTLADFRGKVVMLVFGYTGCPDMCPTTLALMANAMKELGSEASHVQGLFMTVDPKRDTPQHLAQYVPAFDPSFLGLYGDDAATERTVRDFKGYYQANPPEPDGSYTVDHSGQVYVFDEQGRLRLLIRPDTSSPQAVAHDLHLLLTEARG